jgi:hypothetical protein
MNKQEIMELVDEYWSLAFAEGKEGRDHDTPDGAAQRCRAAIEAALPDVPTVPEGWKLVPVEPTEEMVAAGVAYFQKNYDDLFTSEVHYKLMIQSAPLTQKEIEEAESDRWYPKTDATLRGSYQRVWSKLSAAPEPALDVKIQDTNPVVSQISGNVNDKEPAQAEQAEQPRRVMMAKRDPETGSYVGYYADVAQAEQPRNEPVQQELED